METIPELVGDNHEELVVDAGGAAEVPHNDDLVKRLLVQLVLQVLRVGNLGGGRLPLWVGVK